MKRLTVAMLAFAATCLSVRSLAQNNDDMKAMVAYATPGESHKMLAKSAGTWSAAISMWMAPGTQPTTATGTSTNEMIMGGRYLQTKNTGNMMGQPFEGNGIIGYDNVKKVFIYSWIDNFGTGIETLTGTWDDAGKSINFTGTMVDPASGKDVPIREVWKMVDDNKQVMEMYASMNGKEFKTMEIQFTRK